MTLNEVSRHLEDDSLLLVAAIDTDNNGNYRATLDLVSEEELDDNGLWYYRAHTPRVIDGDTIDAVIDLGFGIEITERLRFKVSRPRRYSAYPPPARLPVRLSSLTGWPPSYAS